MNSLGLLTPTDVAERLELTPTVIRKYCRQGRLGVKVGDQWLITEEEFRFFVKIPRPVGSPGKMGFAGLLRAIYGKPVAGGGD